jgi:crotonobetainyl-CoA:carnitine CoA-transferase CaiB-like acyl-CoA transferase
MTFRPLAGLRVLDLTSSFAGPTATAVLGALGAEVTKVERPGAGDEARAWGPPFFDGGSVMFFSVNAGKRSLALDLRAPRGAETLLRLAERADVLVQSLRPGAAERLGIGPDAVRARNPRLVYASIGAFGRRGPRAGEPGYDPLMQAAAGIMSVTGEPDGRPVRVGASLVDIGTGVWAALAIVAAVHEGRGRTLDLALWETAVSLLPYQLADVLAGGDPPGRHGSAFPLIVPYQVFATADGEVMLVAANDRLFARACEALGVPELADDPRFASNPLRIEHRDALIPLLEEALSAARTDDVLARLGAAGVPAARVSDLGDVAVDPQLRASGILQQLAGRQLVSPPFTVDGERPRYATPPPRLGEHGREILLEAGLSEDEIAALARAGTIAL